MNIKFSKPLAYSENYPSPIIKGVTELKWTNLLFNKTHYASDSHFFSVNGRTGLAIIGQYIKLNKEHTVLLPSYHCPALVEPFIWLGVNIRFYKLNKDLSIDIDDFKSKLDKSVKACLFVHFFGFSPDFSQLSPLLKKYKETIIIEDCAHSFYSPQIDNSKNMGDYSVVSCNKFLPSNEGSIVYGIKRDEITNTLTPPSLLSEFKLLLNSLPLIPQLINISRSLVQNKDHHQNIENHKPIPKKDALFRYFNPNDMQQSSSRISQFIIEHSNHKKIKQKRRNNFKFLLKHLEHSKAGKPLFSILPDDIVPYVFPFILNNPQSFDIIKNRGLALFRWEELAESDCSISHFYRDCLVQIPCHQDLTQSNLNDILTIIEEL